jgi:hypothetical protein
MQLVIAFSFCPSLVKPEALHTANYKKLTSNVGEKTSLLRALMLKFRLNTMAIFILKIRYRGIGV